MSEEPFEDDVEPWKVLAEAGFTDDRGVIREPEGHVLTPLQIAAISYLCDEWDYCYEPAQ